MLPLVILYLPETKDFDGPPAGGKFSRCRSSKLQSMLGAVSPTDEVYSDSKPLRALYDIDSYRTRAFVNNLVLSTLGGD